MVVCDTKERFQTNFKCYPTVIFFNFSQKTSFLENFFKAFKVMLTFMFTVCLSSLTLPTKVMMNLIPCLIKLDFKGLISRMKGVKTWPFGYFTYVLRSLSIKISKFEIMPPFRAQPRFFKYKPCNFQEILRFFARTGLIFEFFQTKF